MYGIQELDDKLVSVLSEHFSGSELEEAAYDIDAIVNSYQQDEITKDEALDCIEDIRITQEIEAETSSMQLRIDFINALNVLSKVL